MADINFDCPACGQNLDAAEDLAGREVACPACEAVVRIPGLSGERDEERRLSEDAMKGTTVRLELPNQVTAPPPRRRVIKIKRRPH
jgi:hypothetical protein